VIRRWSLELAISLLVVGCSAKPMQQGQFSCENDSECPPGWHCLSDGYCYSDGGGDTATDTAADTATDTDADTAADTATDTDIATDTNTAAVDECNSTGDCREMYGPLATDCVASHTRESWCNCGGTPCRSIGVTDTDTDTDSVTEQDAGLDAGTD